MTASAGVVVIGLLSGLPGPAEPLTRFEFAETHMGSEFKIVLYSPDEASARRASRAAFDRVAALDAALSDYQPESELMRLCDRAGGPPVVVSEDLFTILQRSRTIYERSSGAFDVTVGPVVRLWRRARRDRKMPAPDTLARARALVSSDLMTLDPEARTVRLARPGMKLDLGGIAKGFASDEAVKVLRWLGHPRALVAGAGDIVVGDPPPGRDGWTIAVAGLDPKAAPERYLSLRNAAVSTSGDAERFVEIDGKRYSHIVDPKTGLGVVDRCSVTVVAPDGATADALDTAVYVLGPDRGLPLIESTEGVFAYIVRATDRGRQVYESRRFANLPRPRPESDRPPVTIVPSP
jgi:thiamine biosynthesis lipoprotein